MNEKPTKPVKSAKQPAPAPGPAPNKQKMTAEDCARLGLDPTVYGHKAK